ncbi:hypothetical protein ACOME3_004116 [Neoechinorhynchus agilis]
MSDTVKLSFFVIRTSVLDEQIFNRTPCNIRHFRIYVIGIFSLSLVSVDLSSFVYKSIFCPDSFDLYVKCARRGGRTWKNIYTASEYVRMDNQDTVGYVADGGRITIEMPSALAA